MRLKLVADQSMKRPEYLTNPTNKRRRNEHNFYFRAVLRRWWPGRLAPQLLEVA
jgi:hypothetical protein